MEGCKEGQRRGAETQHRNMKNGRSQSDGLDFLASFTFHQESNAAGWDGALSCSPLCSLHPLHSTALPAPPIALLVQPYHMAVGTLRLH